MAIASIRIDQPLHTTAPTGQAGVARRDLELGKPVIFRNSNDTDVLRWVWKMIDKPIGSAAALSAVTGPAVTFTPDIEGSYLIRVMINDGLAGEVDLKVGAVLTAGGLRFPATSETAEACNWPIGGSPNEQGWGKDAEAIFRAAVAANTLQGVLAVGNSTGGTNLEISNGDSIVGEDGGAIAFAPTTGDIILTPGGDTIIASGKVKGADGSASAGGDLELEGGAGDGAAQPGGSVTLQGGQGDTAGGAGGTTTISGGAGGATSGAGGAASVQGGSATAGNSAGGDLLLAGGQPTGSGTPGDVTISAFDALSGNVEGGSITIDTGAGSGTQAGGALVGIAGDGGATGAGGSISWLAGAGGITNGTGGAIGLVGGSGAGGNSNGGEVAGFGGNGIGSGTGGLAKIQGGSAGATGVGGAASIRGGAGGATSGAGGAATVLGGSASAGNSAGGAATLQGGAGAGSGDGGAAVVQGAVGGATGNGGYAALNGGSGGASGGDGGSAFVYGGSGVSATATGGSVEILAGPGGSGAAQGGPVYLFSGDGGGTSGNSGDINISTGGVTSGTRGTITLNASDVIISELSYHSVRGSTARGSTNTRIYRWTSVVENVGTDITYSDSAANGGSWTINRAGIYTVSFSIVPNHNGTAAIKKAGALSNTFDETSILIAKTTIAGSSMGGSWTGFCAAASIIWISCSATTDPVGTPVNNNRCSVTRVR